PKALTQFIFNNEIIANGIHLSLTPPPFSKDTLGAIRTFDLSAFAAPDNRGWWPIWHKRDDFNQFWAWQQPNRTTPMAEPINNNRLRNGTDPLHRTFRHI